MWPYLLDLCDRTDSTNGTWYRLSCPQQKSAPHELKPGVEVSEGVKPLPDLLISSRCGDCVSNTPFTYLLTLPLDACVVVVFTDLNRHCEVSGEHLSAMRLCFGSLRHYLSYFRQQRG